MPRWFRALLCSLAELSIPPWSRAGEWPEAVHKYASLYQFPHLSWCFSISDKYQDDVLVNTRIKSILDKKTAPNGTESFWWLFRRSITQDSMVCYIYLDLTGWTNYLRHTTYSASLFIFKEKAKYSRSENGLLAQRTWYRQQVVHI